MKASILITAFTAMLLFSCGSKTNEEFEEAESPTTALGALSNLSKMGEDMEKSMNTAEAKIKERREKGDTLALNYEALIKYLPQNIDGFTRDEPTGSSVNMSGMSFSNAEVEFSNKNGNTIKVTLIDYNQAYGMYQAGTAMWAMGMSIDSPEEKAGGIKLNDEVAGWEVFQKKSKDATITLGIGYRFWLSIEADNQENTEFIKQVAKNIDLENLSKL